MTITAHTPRWSNADHSAITLFVQFPWLNEEVPFTATLNDTDYATELFNAASGGDFGPIAEFIMPTVIIPDVSPRQIRQALTITSLREQVEGAVSYGDQNLKDWWEFSTSFEFNHPQVIAMCEALEVSEEQRVDLWNLAASL